MADNIEGILVICIGFPLPRLVRDIDFFLAVGICYRYMKSEGIFLLSIYISIYLWRIGICYGQYCAYRLEKSKAGHD